MADISLKDRAGDNYMYSDVNTVFLPNSDVVGGFIAYTLESVVFDCENDWRVVYE